jgi:hypothetical protein
LELKTLRQLCAVPCRVVAVFAGITDWQQIQLTKPEKIVDAYFAIDDISVAK